MENENSLHCKVSFRNELRRFPMNGVGFTELQKIIQTLFAIEKEFSLQYRDNENDLVILSSNEELACAISCISGNILQIMVIDPTSPPSMDLDQKSTPPFYPPWGCHFHPHPPPFSTPPFSASFSPTMPFWEGPIRTKESPDWSKKRDVVPEIKGN